MKQAAAWDISNFIWEENHFLNNKPGYYLLMNCLPSICNGLNKNKVPIALRPELTQEIQVHFPYAQIPRECRDFRRSVLNFFSKMSVISYPSEDEVTISSTPELVKDFFSPSTKAEVRYLITYLYKANEENLRILSAKIFWDAERQLVLKDNATAQLECIFCDEIDGDEKCDQVIRKFRKWFEHNPKHDDYRTGDKYGESVSGLSCYNERLGDATVAQQLLDEAIWFEGHYYNYDEKYSTIVKFMHTRDNIFHGFDIQLEEHDEKEIRNKLYK